MLHIILVILKIIGWILLAILGVIVLLSCVVLFTPLRYEIEAKCDGDLSSLEAGVRFSYFLHLINGTVRYADKKLVWKLRIAWKKLGGEEDAADAVKEAADEAGDVLEAGLGAAEKAVEHPSEEKSGDPAENPDPDERADTKQEEDSGTKAEGKSEPEELPGTATDGKCEPEELPGTATGGKCEPEELPETATGGKCEPEELPGTAIGGNSGTEEMSGMVTGGESEAKEIPKTEAAGIKQVECRADTKKEERRSRQKKNHQENAERKKVQKENLLDKLDQLFEKISCKFEAVCDKIKELIRKKDIVMDFLTNEIHKAAFLKVISEIRRLLCRLKPKRLNGNLEFGFEDPSLTGKVLAGLSILYPYTADNFQVSPRFEEKVLKGGIYIKGSAAARLLASMGIRLLLNKNIRTTIKHVRKFKLD